MTATCAARATCSGVLARIARDMHLESDLDDTLNAIVTSAVETVPGAEHAGISEVHGRDGRSNSPTPATP